MPTDYPTTLTEHGCGHWGTVRYHQWQHPLELPKHFDHATIDAVARWLPPGGYAVDVGAHTGDTALPMALAAGPAGCVLALEPNHAVLPVLMRNAEPLLNPSAAQIIVLPYAAMPAAGPYTFHYGDPGCCNGGHAESLTAYQLGGPAAAAVPGFTAVQVHACNLAVLTPPRLDFVKFDTEGMDGPLLAAYANWLRRYRPIIQCELFPLLDSLERCQLREAIEALDYDAFLPHPDGELTRFRDTDFQCFAGPLDLICRPRDAALNPTVPRAPASGPAAPVSTWRFVNHFSFETGGQRMDRDDALGCQRETHTTRDKHGRWSKGQTYYFIDGDPREFRTEADLVVALAARGEHPS